MSPTETLHGSLTTTLTTIDVRFPPFFLTGNRSPCGLSFSLNVFTLFHTHTLTECFTGGARKPFTSLAGMPSHQNTLTFDIFPSLFYPSFLLDFHLFQRLPTLTLIDMYPRGVIMWLEVSYLSKIVEICRSKYGKRNFEEVMMLTILMEMETIKFRNLAKIVPMLYQVDILNTKSNLSYQ